MSDQMVIDIAWKTLWLTLKVAAPALLSAMIIGLIVSIFQAATQINEQTLSFIPKVLAMTIAIMISGPWMIRIMINFTTEIMNTIPVIGR
ncbi:MAG: flagellar biosynthesis protein FliQ [Oligoflexus sp.]